MTLRAPADCSRGKTLFSATSLSLIKDRTRPRLVGEGLGGHRNFFLFISRKQSVLVKLVRFPFLFFASTAKPNGALANIEII